MFSKLNAELQTSSKSKILIEIITWKVKKVTTEQWKISGNKNVEYNKDIQLLHV